MSQRFSRARLGTKRGANLRPLRSEILETSQDARNGEVQLGNCAETQNKTCCILWTSLDRNWVFNGQGTVSSPCESLCDVAGTLRLCFCPVHKERLSLAFLYTLLLGVCVDICLKVSLDMCHLEALSSLVHPCQSLSPRVPRVLTVPRDRPPRFQLYFVRHRSHTCFLLYEVLLPTLKSLDVPDSGAGYTTPQRAGTCYAKCMFLALRSLLAELGVSKAARRRCMLNFRFFFLEKMVKDLDRWHLSHSSHSTSHSQRSDNLLTISDRIMLTVALKQVARRCVKNEGNEGALERAHICLQKIWLVAPPMRWLGLFARDRSESAVALGSEGNPGNGNRFGGFRLHMLSALISAEVRSAFAGPTASKATNPHVDLTGMASAEAAAGGPTLEAVHQALLMCDSRSDLR